MAMLENIRTRYKELFTITMLNPAFESIFKYRNLVNDNIETITSSSIFNVISCEPDTATKELFLDYSMDFRLINNMIICFVRVDIDRPYVEFPADLKIRFLLKAQPDFINKTEVVAAGSAEVYYFTNVDRTGDPSNRYLTINASGVEGIDLKTMAAAEVDQNCFAIIDIHTNVTTPGYEVLNSGVLTSPFFTILFLKKIIT